MTHHICYGPQGQTEHWPDS